MQTLYRCTYKPISQSFKEFNEPNESTLGTTRVTKIAYFLHVRGHPRNIPITAADGTGHEAYCMFGLSPEYPAVTAAAPVQPPGMWGWINAELRNI